jgi:hypothetical protein
MVIMQTSQVICAAEHVKIAAFFDEPARKSLLHVLCKKHYRRY